jgi:hypothetical protein
MGEYPTKSPMGPVAGSVKKALLVIKGSFKLSISISVAFGSSFIIWSFIVKKYNPKNNPNDMSIYANNNNILLIKTIIFINSSTSTVT